MLVSELKYKWAARRIRSLGEKGGRASRHSKPRTFAVILDSDDRLLWEKFHALASEPGLADADLVILCLMDVKAEGTEIVPFTAGDLSWGGRIKNEGALDFFQKEFELLLSFTAQAGPLVRFAVQATRADLKIGRQKSGSALYDLSISTRYDEVELFLEEVKKYLKILKNKG